MLTPSCRVAVAVSGGADSVCLLHILNDLSVRLGLTLSVVHLNHKLRGEASDGDAEWVRSLATTLGLRCWVETADIEAAAGNLEEAGREARQALFARLLASGEADCIATGHTANDQAETVLYRLLRGAGTAGLSAIRPVSGRVVRPLLDVTRPEVEQYLRLRGIEWREDASNSDLRFARNRIRHTLMPLLAAEHNPAVVEVLNATAAVARDEQNYWDAVVEAEASKLLKRQQSAVLLRAPDLRRHPAALQRRLLRRAVEAVKGDLRSVGVLHVEQMMALAHQGEGHGRVQFAGLDVFRSFEWMRVSPVRRGDRSDHDYSFVVTLPCQIRLPWQTTTLHMQVLDKEAIKLSHRVYNGDSLLDFARLGGPLELRNWHPGDRYETASGDTKVKQLFQRERVPLWERQGWPILTCGGKLAWARTFGVAAEYAPCADSEQLLRISERPIEDSAEPIGHAVASED